jgi:hypothetical protein
MLREQPRLTFVEAPLSGRFHYGDMRCFLVKDGKIISEEFLEQATDEECLFEARRLFDLRGKGADGFEIWDGARFVYRYLD